MDALLMMIAANWVAGLLLLAGIALLGAEMFMPGFGVLGISGAICLVIGIIVAYDSPLQTLLLILVLLVILALIFALAMRSASRGRLSRTALVLETTETAESGYTSNQDMTWLEGKRGKTLTVLRPAGAAMIEGQRLDVVTDASFVREGVPIEVIKVEGRRIVVQQMDEPGEESEAQA